METNNSALNTKSCPTDAELDKIISQLRRVELSNDVLTQLYGCSHIELDEDMTGEHEIVRFVYDDDRPSLDLDMNGFRQLCYDINLTLNTFNIWVPKD